MKSKREISLFTLLFVFCLVAAPARAAVTLSGYGGAYQYVLFGRYPQDGDGKGGFLTQPIIWRVLSANANEALLLSEKLLDCVRFGTNNTWSASNLRSWLNAGAGTFVSGNDAPINGFLHADNFTQKEQDAMKQSSVNTNEVNNDAAGTAGGDKGDTPDRMFVLSYQDMKNTSYGFSNAGPHSPAQARAAFRTDYAVSHSTQATDEHPYWLRSPFSGDTGFLWVVGGAGLLTGSGTGAGFNYNSVRPAFNLNPFALLYKSASSASGAAGEKTNPFALYVETGNTDLLYAAADGSNKIVLNARAPGVKLAHAYNDAGENGNFAAADFQVNGKNITSAAVGANGEIILTCADDITAGSTLKYTHAGAGKAIGLVGTGVAIPVSAWPSQGIPVTYDNDPPPSDNPNPDNPSPDNPNPNPNPGGGGGCGNTGVGTLGALALVLMATRKTKK